MVDAQLMLRISADIAQAERAVATFEQKLTKAGERVSTMGRNMTAAFTVPIAGAMTLAGKEFMGMETTLAQMQGLAGVAEEEIEGITSAIGKLAAETGKAPQELAKGMYFIRSSGLAGQEAFDVLGMAAKASAAGLGETQVIADLLTSAMNAYGSENLSAAQATDILVAAVREGKGEAWALAGSLGQVMPIASEMGVAFDQVAASVAAMTRTGTNAETASMELKNILSALLKPSDMANTQLEAMGMSAAGLRKQIKEEGLLSALMSIRTATNEFGEDAMAKVFPNIRALMGVLDLMGANLEDNVAIFGALENSTGALDHAFGKISETSQHKLNTATANVKTSLGKLGDTVMDNVVVAIDWASKKVEQFSAWWDRLDDSTQNFIVKAAMVVAAIGPIGLVVGSTTKGVGALVGGIGDLVGGIGKLIKHAAPGGAAVDTIAKAAGTATTNVGGLKSVFSGLSAFLSGPTFAAAMAALAPLLLLAGAAAIISKVLKLRENPELIPTTTEAGQQLQEKQRVSGEMDYWTQPSEPQTRATLDSFDGGGTVGGPIGSPRIIRAHGGEVIRTPEQEAALRGGVTINVTGNTIASDYDVDRIGDLIVQRLNLAAIHP